MKWKLCLCCGSQKTCYWPKAKPERLKKLIKEHAESHEDWQRHQVIVRGIFSSYDLSRLKLTRSQITSDLSYTEDERPRRRIRPHRYIGL
ncbi:hypothetical protein V5799_007779 [Amblyomma americanum]|uniref:Uncharacterized protein n=1 Tax=Amblyomma americanum TaxID=6943 RepID=A0AAQ4FFW9_AMBAM